MLRAELYLCMNEGKVIVSCYSVDRHIGDICRVKTVELIYWTRLNVTMHSLHQKCTYMFCSLRSYLRSAYILNHTECILYNAFIASEMQPYVHVLFSTKLSQISLFTGSDWMYTMHSLHQKYSRTYSRACVVLYEAISDQLKKQVASQSSAGPKVSAWYQTGVQCTHTCAFIAAKSVVYVFKTQRTPNSVVFLFQVR